MKNSKFDAEKVFDEFPAEEQEEVRELWQESKSAGAVEPEVPDDEVEQALSNVHEQIGADTGMSNSWRWLAAAAVILLMFGAGILFIPRTVTAPHGELTTATLPDGSTVELNSGSELQYGWLFDITNRSVSLDGEAYFAVQESEEPFVVSAQGTKVEVTGTEFNVQSWSANPDVETTVSVAEGSVAFYPNGKQNQAVYLMPGETSRWTQAMEQPSDPKPIALDKISGWREGKLIFDQQTLAVIFQELERRFDTRITLEASDMAGETLTTYYNNPKDVASILKDICRVKGLRFAPTANGYRVYK